MLADPEEAWWGVPSGRQGWAAGMLALGFLRAMEESTKTDVNAGKSLSGGEGSGRSAGLLHGLKEECVGELQDDR